VKEALEILVGRDQLEGVTGSKTKQEVVAWQQMTLEKLPVVLILHLKYFDYRSDGCTKILKKVEFPVELKIDASMLQLNPRFRISISKPICCRNPRLEKDVAEATRLSPVCGGVSRWKGGLQGPLHHGRVPHGLQQLVALRRQLGEAGQREARPPAAHPAGALPSVLPPLRHPAAAAAAVPAADRQRRRIEWSGGQQLLLIKCRGQQVKGDRDEGAAVKMHQNFKC